jgi:ketosteroid isomerase-like protein
LAQADDVQDNKQTIGGDMTARTSRQQVIEAWKAFASRDPARVGAVFTEDAEWLAPAGNGTAIALGHSHHMIGRAAITHFLTHEFPRLFAQDVQVDFKTVLADGETVVVEERMRATLADGKAYDNDYCFIFELQDGRIHRVREYMDTLKGTKMILG